MIIYVLVLLSRRTPFSLNLSAVRHIGKPVMRDYLTKMLPLTTNELLWSSGLLVYFWAYTHISEASLPAITVADQVANIAWVIFMGMSSAVSVMVGRHLGANEFELAKKNVKRLFGLGVMIAGVCVGLAFISAQFIGLVFSSLSSKQIPLAKQLIYITACFGPFNALFGIAFFVLRAGGDTRNAMLLDSGYMWLLPVPVALAMGFLLPDRIDIRLAMLIMQLLMNLKIIWALRVVRQGTWLKNITRVED